MKRNIERKLESIFELDSWTWDDLATIMCRHYGGPDLAEFVDALGRAHTASSSSRAEAR